MYKCDNKLTHQKYKTSGKFTKKKKNEESKDWEIIRIKKFTKTCKVENTTDLW